MTNKEIQESFLDIWEGKNEEVVDYTAITNGEDLLELLSDDGMKWATALSQSYKKYSGHEIDVEFLFPWCANMIEHSNDVRRWAREAAEKESLDNPAS